MEKENLPKDNYSANQIREPYISNEPTQKPAEKTSIPLVAGILLILSGVFSLIVWISIIFTVDVEMIASAVDLSQLQNIDPSWTAERFRDMLVLCGTAFAILSLFPLLGGILAIKKKLWGIVLGCCIIGLSTFIIIIPGILCVIGLVLVVMSRKEFQ